MCRFTAFAALAAMLSACQDGSPMVGLGIDDVYVTERMRKVMLHPEFEGDRYEWIMERDGSRGDSLVSERRDFIFVPASPGTYRFLLRIHDVANPVEHRFSVVVKGEEVSYSRYISDVYEYCPAPGQFVNKMPKYEKGDTAEDMVKKVEESISGQNNVLVSLGGYGGYVTFGFDHTVVNVPGMNDFKILGNAFYAAANPNPSAPESGGSAEPGIVMVSLDTNGNGLPDDGWYELAGSEYGSPLTQHGYSIVYTKPEEGHVPVPVKGTPVTDSRYIRWQANDGTSGYIEKNSYHTQSYFPEWTESGTLTFTGTKLADNAVDESGNRTYYVLYSYDWGYADNHPNDKEEKISFDIDWAVDSLGRKVHLPGADFVRVYTGVNQQCGWLGETSTEICGAEDLHIDTAGTIR